MRDKCIGLNNYLAIKRFYDESLENGIISEYYYSSFINHLNYLMSHDDLCEIDCFEVNE